MNKTKIFGAVLAFVLSIFLPYSLSLIASSDEVDQSYKPYPAFGTYKISSNSPIAQTFKPSKDTLTSLQIVINTSSSSSHNFTATVTRGGSNIGQASTTQSLTPGSKTISFEFSPSVSLVPGSEHRVYISTSDSSAAWSYGETGNTGTYSGGYAIVGGANLSDVDLHFATYGPVVLQEQPKEETKETPSEEKEIGAIGIPESLEVLDKGADFVELSWDSLDDENVKGYKVYYGSTPTDLEQEVDVGNDTSYTIRGLEENTLYYFAVSAYDQDRKEGDKSAILQTRTEKAKKQLSSLDLWWYIARIASVLILILAAILGYRWFKKKKAKDKKEEKPSSKENSIDKEQEIPVRKDTKETKSEEEKNTEISKED